MNSLCKLTNGLLMSPVNIQRSVFEMDFSCIQRGSKMAGQVFYCKKNDFTWMLYKIGILDKKLFIAYA